MKHSAIRTFAAGAALLLLLSSCGGTVQENRDAPSSAAENAPAAEPAQDQPGTPDADKLPDDAPAVEEEAGDAQETAAPEMTQEEILALATEYIGKPVDDLIAVIGEPEDRDYAPSCMGDGEDGNLYYGGFIVYTYRENEEETVQDVE